MKRWNLLMIMSLVLFGPLLAQGQTIEVGPYVQFTGPYSAVVRWDTNIACNSIVDYGMTTALGLRKTDSSLTTVHEISIDNLEWQTRYYYKVGFSNGSSETLTELYWPPPEWGFDTTINYTQIDCTNIPSPYPVDSMTEIYENAAGRIIAQTGVTKGFCLVLGGGEGRLAFELAKRSDLIIVSVDEDVDKINDSVGKLRQAGVYGVRVTARHVTSLSSMPFTKYFFDLIVSDRMISDGQCPGTAEEMFRVLRPCGGRAYLGQPDGCPNVLTANELETWLGSLSYDPNYSDGTWAQIVRAPLMTTSEDGWWSHQYGGAHNNGNSYDDLEGADHSSNLSVQWIGQPGEDISLDRHFRIPSPVAANGRLYHQGNHRIIAIGSYNGAILWSLEIPHWRRTNVPRDASNVCADDNAVYIAARDKCWRLDGNTGLRTHTYTINDPAYDWGCVFRSGSYLYGSAVKEGSSYTAGLDYQGAYDSWGDPAETAKVCSDYIFAKNIITGMPAWTDNRANRGVIINPTIAIGGGRVYFVESRSSTVKNYSSGRIGIPELWDDQYLVSLNADTGALLWEKPIAIKDGDNVFFLLYAQETIIVQSSNVADQRNYLYAYYANTGNAKWSSSEGWRANHHGQHMHRAVVVGDAVYLTPNARYLSNGNVKRSGLPDGMCGTTSGTAHALFYRGHYNTGYYTDLNMWSVHTGIESGWAAIRPSCWLSVISGGGMVLAPEGGGGCTCNSYFNTSVAWINIGD